MTILYAVGGKFAGQCIEDVNKYIGGKDNGSETIGVRTRVHRWSKIISDYGNKQSDYLSAASYGRNENRNDEVSVTASGHNGKSDVSRGREDQQGERDGLKRSRKDKPRRIVPTPEEAKALGERLKAREEEKAAQKRKERDETIKRLVYTSPGFAPYRSIKDNLSSMADQYGRIPQGESPARDVTVPVSTDGETKVRKTVRTAMESEITSEAVLPAIEESVVSGVLNYDRH